MQLTDAPIHVKTKDRLHTLCDKSMGIFSKHSTDIGKTDLEQIVLIPKDNIKPLDNKYIHYHANTMCAS